MLRDSKSARALWLACALMQLALPGAAAWADALLDATPVGPATTHFESNTTSSCPRLHPPDCALCQFLTAARSTAQRISFELGVASARIRPPVAPVLGRRAGCLAHPQPRAPPVLS